MTNRVSNEEIKFIHHRSEIISKGSFRFFLFIQSEIRFSNNMIFIIESFIATRFTWPLESAESYNLIKIDASHMSRDCKLNLYTRISSEIKID